MGHESDEVVVSEVVVSENGAPSPAAPDGDLLTLLYDRLREVARRHMGSERAGHTLQPTALVHEVYIRLAAHQQNMTSRLHFMRAAAGVMRRVLVDHARAQKSAKRGGDWTRRALETVCLTEDCSPIDAIALDEALTRLEHLHPRQAAGVELRFYAGLTAEEIAESLECSVGTVEKDWRAARAWLHAKLATDR